MTTDNTNKEKENLRKLLAFLQEQILNRPENAWFADELRYYLGISSQSSSKADKYLGLDYNPDEIKTIIDYGFIADEYVRNCLQSDYREMLRYRYGTSEHKIDFSEFCRYALMQVERLLNLYYSSKGTFDVIKAYIEAFNPYAYLSSVKSLENINLATKIYAFCTEFNIKKFRKTLNNAKEVRDHQNRGALAQEDEDTFFFKHQKELLKAGYPLLPDTGWVNWKQLNQTNRALYNEYQASVENTPNHKRYIIIGWKRSLPFKDVIDALTFVALRVKISLSQS